MGLPLLIHPDILFGFNIENAITTLSGWRERKRKGVGPWAPGGARWEKENEKRGLFPLPIVPRALAIFRLGIPSGQVIHGSLHIDSLIY